MVEYLPYSRPCLGEDELQAVKGVISSGWISRGKTIEMFEESVSAYCGARYAVAVSSGTAGLHLAAIVSGLKPGKRFWTTPMSFVATANCGLYTGAQVDFVDIESDTVNMDVEKLSAKLRMAEKDGCIPDVLIPVHFAGQSCNMASISELAEAYGFKIIEDACHALGGEYQGRKVGSCGLSDMSVFSFHPTKSITTGEGGMVLTNDVSTYEQLIKLRNNGITKDPKILHENHGPWYYEQQHLGFNYWLTEIQCAVGLCQMEKLDEFVAKRRKLASLYDNLSLEQKWRPLTVKDESLSARHIYVISLDLKNTGMRRDEVMAAMEKAGIGVQVHYVPIPAQPYYRSLGFRPEAFPEANRYYKEAITLPLHTEMVDSDVQNVVETLGGIVS